MCVVYSLIGSRTGVVGWEEFDYRLSMLDEECFCGSDMYLDEMDVVPFQFRSSIDSCSK